MLMKTNVNDNQRGTLMEIYVGNIPKGSRPGEIRKIIENAIKEKVFPRLFEKIIETGQINKGVGVKIRKTKNTNGEYRYGHVTVHSSGLGQLAMDSLSNAELRGNCLNAREFITRSQHNDRRASHGDAASLDFPCRRVHERRNGH